jgi:hypothetical protein
MSVSKTGQTVRAECRGEGRVQEQGYSYTYTSAALHCVYGNDRDDIVSFLHTHSHGTEERAERRRCGGD